MASSSCPDTLVDVSDEEEYFPATEVDATSTVEDDDDEFNGEPMAEEELAELQLQEMNREMLQAVQTPVAPPLAWPWRVDPVVPGRLQLVFAATRVCRALIRQARASRQRAAWMRDRLFPTIDLAYSVISRSTIP